MQKLQNKNLLFHASKVLVKITYNRIQSKIEENLG